LAALLPRHVLDEPVAGLALGHVQHRSGWVLAAVGAHLVSSKIARSCSSVTGSSVNVFALRAS